LLRTLASINPGLCKRKRGREKRKREKEEKESRGMWKKEKSRVGVVRGYSKGEENEQKRQGGKLR